MKTIAISGKGGTGKSTISSLIVRFLNEHFSKSILVVDADPNVNLNEILGVPIKETIGTIREEMKSLGGNVPGGMTKQAFLEYKIQSSLIETENFDLLAMGCPEGPGCYCYSNNLLRDILNKLSNNYDFVVIDNEAGMEHLSRRIVSNIDYLFMISDPIVRGVHAASKISRVVKELETRIKEKYLILNRVRNSIPEPVAKSIETAGLKLIGTIPEDNKILEMDNMGRPIWPIWEDLVAYKAIENFMKKLDIDRSSI